MHPATIEAGKSYSNGQFGNRWEVRSVIRCTEETVHYKVSVGEQRRRNFTCPLAEFARWATHEVIRNENSWERALA